MSLRIIVKSAQIEGWISERSGVGAATPSQHYYSDLAVLFDGDKTDYETLSVDELVETMPGQ